MATKDRFNCILNIFSGGPSAPYRDDLNNQYNEESRYNQYTGGLSEEEQIRRATEESRRQTGGSL